MATHSSILAWEIPWREEPGRLQAGGGKQSDMTEQLGWSWMTNKENESLGNGYTMPKYL